MLCYLSVYYKISFGDNAEKLKIHWFCEEWKNLNVIMCIEYMVICFTAFRKERTLRLSKLKIRT